MGRYKRKKQYYNSGYPGQSHGQADSKTGNPFTNREKQRVRKYLQDYRNKKLAWLLQEESNNKNATIDQNGNRDDQVYTNNSNKNKNWILNQATTQPIVIANITFPMLDVDTISQPYLALPSEISFKQRQFIHDCCMDLTLYHCGIGHHKGPNRFVAISVYADVFGEIPGYQMPDYLDFPFAQKPWFLQHKIKARRDPDTCHYKKKIETLLDQPSQCLRDEIDDLDFHEWDGADLSNIPPPSSDDNNWMLVDTPAKMKQCLQELTNGKPTEIAFDLEAYNPSKYCQITCLLQLSSNLGKDYIIDPLAESVWDHIGELRSLFGDPNIVKAGHSVAGLDARCLQRDFGIFLVNVFDTYEAAKVLQLPLQGLADVCQHYGLRTSEEYVSLKSQYQTTDWRQRPLTDPMMLYGRYDVHYLLRLRKLMMRDLTHQEFFADVDAEAKLVAESLALTIAQMQEWEDDVVMPAPEAMEVEEDDYEEEDDDAYESAPEDNSSKIEDHDRFFTPQNSFKDLDDYDANAVDNNDVPEASKSDMDLVKETKLAPTELLRMQPRLMQVLSYSQERCLDLWTSRSEPHFRNPIFVSIMQPPRNPGGKNNGNNQQPQQGLTQSQTLLYEDLVRLRANVARRRECLPGFVCSLDDLARITAGRPTNRDALKLISYFLPESLEAAAGGLTMLDQVFVLTTRSLKFDKVAISPYDAAVRRYHAVKENGTSKSGTPGENDWKVKVAKGALILSVVCGGVYIATVVVARRKRK